jgi:predicted RNA-binding protein (virulence factor B family)
MQSRLQVLIENDIRFMVFGRRIESHFMTLNDCSLPEAFKDRFIGISETEFREDISSSEIKIERLREMNDKAT